MNSTIQSDAGHNINRADMQVRPSGWFHHKPLDLSQQSIRLLEVLPDLSPDGRIQCHLLHSTTRSTYQCLSYCWGPTGKYQLRHVIEIDEALFEVFSNLWDFLEAFRREASYTCKTPQLWIDAICIDQATTQERNHQVQNMAAIYSQAHQVIIWLGTGDDDQRDALEAIGRHSPNVQTQKEMESLLALCENEYWKRTWVIQEVMLAKKLILMYDNQRIPWSSWVILHRKQPYLHVMEKKQQSDKTVTNRFDVSKGRVMVLEYYKFREKQRQFTLKELLATFGHSKCADLRDRIFALLGLCEEGVKGLVRADYDIGILELFSQIVLSCFPDSTADAQMLAKVLGFPDGWERSHPKYWRNYFSICVLSEFRPEALDELVRQIAPLCPSCGCQLPLVLLPERYRDQSAKHYFCCLFPFDSDKRDHLLLLAEPAQDNRNFVEVARSIGATLSKERHIQVSLYGADGRAHEGAQFLSIRRSCEAESWVFPENDLHNAITVPTNPSGHHYRVEERHLSRSCFIERDVSRLSRVSWF
ncbi:hypothetical protein PV04_09645 [Phialophora macrospora]|uniref:Heterokaryon incompatibility domain-containing protein n=1 Tax=Phialophora macrospora TaxID=1851006 RepID=A0A0D2DR95_9EURO|nr:hypothetical protein PV04_09645 [Phialophora macrospora]